MRSYPRNSPQAAARIVALATLADGHLDKAELDVLDRLGIHDELGLQPEQLQAVVRAYCEDLLAAAQLTWDVACRVDARTLAALLAEIEAPELRLKVLELCVAAADADGQLSENESAILAAAAAHWGIVPQPANGGSSSAAR